MRDVTTFHVAKETMVALFGLEKDALHVYVGLTIFLLTAMVLRLPLRDLRLLGVVFLAAVAGELLDLYRYLRPEEPPTWGNNWHDIWNTMFWPTVLCLLMRTKRLLPG